MAQETVDRRTALKLAASYGGLVAFGAGALPVEAGAQTAKDVQPMSMEPKWRCFRVGDATVTVVLDGVRVGDGPYPTFGADQDAGAVAELMRANFLPENRFATVFLPLLVERAGQLVLFDTGMGPSGRANGLGLLVERMAQAGYRPQDVDLVVLTHMHGDHIGGLMEEGGRPAFPNARLVVGRREYDWWTSDEAKAGDRKDGAALVAKNVVPLAEKATFVEDGDEVAPGIVARAAFGHSPGHLVFEMTFGDAKLWHAADTANHYVASLQKPDWRVRFDQDPAAATTTRRRVFDMLAERREPFIGYHMPYPGIGFAERAGEGFRFVPIAYQFDL